jgi:hypothetical protein
MLPRAYDIDFGYRRLAKVQVFIVSARNPFCFCLASFPCLLYGHRCLYALASRVYQIELDHYLLASNRAAVSTLAN